MKAFFELKVCVKSLAKGYEEWSLFSEFNELTNIDRSLMELAKRLCDCKVNKNYIVECVILFLNKIIILKKVY